MWKRAAYIERHAAHFIKTFIDTFTTSEMTSKKCHCIFVSKTPNLVIRYSPYKELLNRLSTDMDVTYNVTCALQNVGNQLVTGDIRFTEGTMTSKGGSTFLSARQQILLYVTHHQRNCWAAYQQRWMLPWRHVHWQNVGNYAVKGDIRFTVRNTAFKGGRAFTVRDSSNLLVRYWQHKKLQPPLSRDMDVTWNVPVLTLQNVGSHPVTGSISSSSCSSFIFIDKTYRTEIYLNGSQQRRTTWA